MTYEIIKQIKNNKLLLSVNNGTDCDFILIDNTDVTSEYFIYDITVYWSSNNFKRCFMQATHKENFLLKPELFIESYSNNKSFFPLNAKYGWKDSELTEKDKKLLNI